MHTQTTSKNESKRRFNSIVYHLPVYRCIYPCFHISILYSSMWFIICVCSHIHVAMYAWLCMHFYLCASIGQRLLSDVFHCGSPHCLLRWGSFTEPSTHWASYDCPEISEGSLVSVPLELKLKLHNSMPEFCMSAGGLELRTPCVSAGTFLTEMSPQSPILFSYIHSL